MASMQSSPNGGDLKQGMRCSMDATLCGACSFCGTHEISSPNATLVHLNRAAKRSRL
jgi:hypothetical protein